MHHDVLLCVSLRVPAAWPFDDNQLSYPTINLLPWPSDDPAQPDKYFLYFFGARKGQVYSLDRDSNLVWRPDLAIPYFPLPDVVAASSASAPSVMLPFKPPYAQHTHEVVM